MRNLFSFLFSASTLMVGVSPAEGSAEPPAEHSKGSTPSKAGQSGMCSSDDVSGDQWNVEVRGNVVRLTRAKELIRFRVEEGGVVSELQGAAPFGFSDIKVDLDKISKLTTIPHPPRSVMERACLTPASRHSQELSSEMGLAQVIHKSQDLMRGIADFKKNEESGKIDEVKIGAQLLGALNETVSVYTFPIALSYSMAKTFCENAGMHLPRKDEILSPTVDQTRIDEFRTKSLLTSRQYFWADDEGKPQKLDSHSFGWRNMKATEASDATIGVMCVGSPETAAKKFNVLHRLGRSE